MLLAKPDIILWMGNIKMVRWMFDMQYRKKQVWACFLSLVECFVKFTPGKILGTYEDAKVNLV